MRHITPKMLKDGIIPELETKYDEYFKVKTLDWDETLKLVDEFITKHNRRPCKDKKKPQKPKNVKKLKKKDKKLHEENDGEDNNDNNDNDNDNDDDDDD